MADMPDNPTAAQNYAGVFGGRVGFGTRPALVVVDFIRAYVTPDSPFFAPDARDAVRRTVALYAAAKSVGAPVAFTRVVYAPGAPDGGWFVKKVPALARLVAGEPLADFVPELQPAPDDGVFAKQYASAFFGTSLASFLASRGVDTVVVAGVSTSGCVRATAVDAMQYGYRTIVARECVADRHPGPHEASLFDIASKYGDVVATEDAVRGFLASRAAV